MSNEPWETSTCERCGLPVRRRTLPGTFWWHDMNSKMECPEEYAVTCSKCGCGDGTNGHAAGCIDGRGWYDR